MPAAVLLDPSILPLLRCPANGALLTLAPGELLDTLNRLAAAGTLRIVGGGLMIEPLDAGLLRTDGVRLYPIVRGIPRLVSNEAIALEVTANH